MYNTPPTRTRIWSPRHDRRANGQLHFHTQPTTTYTKRTEIPTTQDGFHHPKSHLATLPNPTEAFARRGAPFTFDAQRFVAAVAKLKSGSSTDEIALPGFDHAVKDPVEDEIVVKTDTKVVLLEGNYVLLDEKPWDAIAEMVDEK